MRAIGWSAIVWEVSNTFGGAHPMIGVDDPDVTVVRQRCRKELHVSPFIGMEINSIISALFAAATG